jgi:hypothetical protein
MITPEAASIARFFEAKLSVGRVLITTLTACLTIYQDIIISYVLN